MEPYTSLLDLAGLLLSADTTESLAETVLQRLVDIAQADRGYLVVREQGELAVKCDIRFDRASVTPEERRVSRRLVRRVIETREPFVSSDVFGDARIGPTESLEGAGARAVLVVPLSAAGEVYGVIYLDRSDVRSLAGKPFSEEALRFITDAASLAGQVLRRAIERDEMKSRMASLERDLFAKYDFQGIVTCDEAMIAMLKTVAQVAPSDATVLVLGETGTGKELIARAIHANSKRAHRAFVPVHCSALPSSLIESELFGHTRGAFTGAHQERAGRVAQANGGTLFLDEVAEIPLEVQAKLLRFLQFGEVQKIGSDRVEKVDVRVVAATHRSLKQMVEEGKFRQDLYYRLNVVQLKIPPLRDRLRDVPLLVDAFLRPKQPASGPKMRFTDAAMALLCAYDYPGNVRELLHIVERACVLARGPDLGVEVLPPELVPVPEPAEEEPNEKDLPGSLAAVRAEAVRVAERAYLVDLLERSGGNVSSAARMSGIHRSYLQRLMSKHKLRSG